MQFGLKITPMKALAGNTTLYEAAYGKKPDFCGVCKWGSCCWVQNELVAKLDDQVSEGV